MESLNNGRLDETDLTPGSSEKDVDDVLNSAAAAISPKNAVNELQLTMDELTSDIDLVNRKTPVDPTLAFGPGSMAVVCQPNANQTGNEDLSRYY